MAHYDVGRQSVHDGEIRFLLSSRERPHALILWLESGGYMISLSGHTPSADALDSDAMRGNIPRLLHWSLRWMLNYLEE